MPALYRSLIRSVPRPHCRPRPRHGTRPPYKTWGSASYLSPLNGLGGSEGVCVRPLALVATITCSVVKVQTLRYLRV